MFSSEPMSLVAIAEPVESEMVLQSYLAGLQLSNDSGTPNSVIDVTAGIAADSTAAVYIQLGSFTKSTAKPFTAGSGGNGMGAGLTVANNTWYHVFAIMNAGAGDIYFDTSASAANAPAGTTNFRRIGSFKTDGAAHILAFTQNGDEFLWGTPTLDVNGSTVSTSQSLLTVNIPLGAKINWTGYMQVDYESATDAIALYAPDMGAQGANSWITGRDTVYVSSSSEVASLWANIRSNTSSQIAAASEAANATAYIVTLGWIDTRGRDN